MLWGEKGVAALRGLKETLQAFMRHGKLLTWEHHLQFLVPLALEVIYTGVCVGLCQFSQMKILKSYR